jgi:hypothetical protein
VEEHNNLGVIEGFARVLQTTQHKKIKIIMHKNKIGKNIQQFILVIFV